VKGSTAKKIEDRTNNLPLYFVDSSVFLEVIMKQMHSQECLSFFNRASYKYQLITSTIVMGEVVKVLNKLENNVVKRESLLFFADILENSRLSIISMNFECLSNIEQIRMIEPYLMPSDSMIFSSALTESAEAFITLDSDFSSRLSIEFDINIKKPVET